LIARLELVAAVGLDEAVKHGEGDREREDGGVAQLAEDGVGGAIGGGAAGEVVAPRGEGGEAVAVEVVAEVVGVATEGVEGVHGAAQLGGEQARCDGEVLVVGLGEVGVVGRLVSGPCGDGDGRRCVHGGGRCGGMGV
jgi:hypothetical protein